MQITVIYFAGIFCLCKTPQSLLGAARRPFLCRLNHVNLHGSDFAYSVASGTAVGAASAAMFFKRRLITAEAATTTALTVMARDGASTREPRGGMRVQLAFDNFEASLAR